MVLKRRGIIETPDLPERYRLGRVGVVKVASAATPSLQSPSALSTILAPAVPGGAAAPAPGPALELPQEGIDLRHVLASYEERLIKQALERSGGNKNRAASLLGLNRTTLVEKLKRIPSLRGQLIDAAAAVSEPEPRGEGVSDAASEVPPRPES